MCRRVSYTPGLLAALPGLSERCAWGALACIRLFSSLQGLVEGFFRVMHKMTKETPTVWEQGASMRIRLALRMQSCKHAGNCVHSRMSTQKKRLKALSTVISIIINLWSITFLYTSHTLPSSAQL